nr:hypothetical protein [Tanacetum cinerariifolium]
MAGHSQKWYDETSSRNVSDISNVDGLAAVASKLDNLRRDMKKLKENFHAIQVGCQICEGPRLNKECPLNEEGKQLEEVKYGEFERFTPFNGSNGAKFRVGPSGYYTRTDNQQPYKEKRPSLEELMNKHQEESFNFYAMADLGASVNGMPMGIFEFLKLTNLRKTYMLIEVANMMKKAPLGVVENILVGRNGNGAGLGPATTLHPRTRLANHASNLPRSPMGILSGSSIGARCSPKPAPNPVGDLIEATLQAHCSTKDTIERKNMKGVGLSFLDFLLVKYGGCQMNDSIWGQSYAKWYKGNSHDSKPRTRDCTFKEWMIVRIRHTDVNGSVKKALLKSWVIDCFEETLDPDKDPMERNFDDYKWVFDLVIEQLADAYELGIEKKSHILDMIWENCKNIQGKAKEWWYDYWFEEDEKQENRDKKYDPPMVHMETFEITRYSFNNGNSFICVTDKIKDTLSLGQENGPRFRKMI